MRFNNRSIVIIRQLQFTIYNLLYVGEICLLSALGNYCNAF